MKKNITFLFLILSTSIFSQDFSRYDDVQTEEVQSTPYTFVEQMPEYTGGESAMINYLQKNIKYPQSAIDSNIQGTVNVEIVINEDGSVSNAKVLTGLDSECNREALRVVSSMPKWRPGRQNKKPVKTYFTIPITFSL